MTSDYSVIVISQLLTCLIACCCVDKLVPFCLINLEKSEVSEMEKTIKCRFFWILSRKQSITVRENSFDLNG
ncbi:hypothetical protein BT93_G0462 [Corymbia citriodora subsp. variegata]|nr:hypothetical protein BT93_G0462 [Corymbia citriodora subsp. variegata]